MSSPPGLSRPFGVAVLAVAAAVGVGVFLSRSPTTGSGSAAEGGSTPPSIPPAPAAAPPLSLEAPRPGPSTGQLWRPVAPGGPSTPVPPGPREQADELFNAVMSADEQGNRVVVEALVPQALAAYRRLPNLDPDGVFHLAQLELTAGKPAEARASAQKVLAANPNHLLLLSVSARAATAQGDRAAARDFNQRLVQAFAAESTQPRPEYRDHARILPTQKAQAEAALKQ